MTWVPRVVVAERRVAERRVRPDIPPVPDRRVGSERRSVQEKRGLAQPHSATRFVLPFEVRLSATPPAGPPLDSGLGYRLVNPKPPDRPVDAVPPDADAETERAERERLDWILEGISERRRYLTDEVADVLFERASWWELDGLKKEDLGWTFTSPDGTQSCMALRPPALVLFEDARAAQNAQANVLTSGFLILEIAFLHQHSADGQRIGVRLDDLLLCNELFRCWRKPFDKHDVRFGDQMKAFSDAIAKLLGATAANDYNWRWRALLNLPLRCPDGDKWVECSLAGIQRQSTHSSYPFTYADDRSYTWTRALMDDAALSGLQPPQGYWTKLLNVDPPSKTSRESNSASKFEQEWAQQRTYLRWAHCGTRYGFSDFSGAMWSGICREPPTWQHWSQMYFDQTLLLLYLRVTLFRFSGELTRVSAGLRTEVDSRETEEWARNFRDLRMQFTKFVNLYRFPLLSNQQQAIEMYALAQRHMDIKDLYDEIASEVRSSDELLELVQGDHRNRLAEARNRLALTLNWGAFLGLACGLSLAWIDVTVERWRPELWGWLRQLMEWMCLEPGWLEVNGTFRDLLTPFIVSIAFLWGLMRVGQCLGRVFRRAIRRRKSGGPT